MCLKRQYTAIQIRNATCGGKSYLAFDNFVDKLKYFKLKKKSVSDNEMKIITKSSKIGYYVRHKTSYQVWAFSKRVFVKLLGDSRKMYVVNKHAHRGYIFDPNYRGKYMIGASCKLELLSAEHVFNVLEK